MKWKILVESAPDTFTPTGEVFDDQFVGAWGDEEAKILETHLQQLKDNDADSRSYACEMISG